MHNVESVRKAVVGIQVSISSAATSSMTDAEFHISSDAEVMPPTDFPIPAESHRTVGSTVKERRFSAA
jgi:hypothetical protein